MRNYRVSGLAFALLMIVGPLQDADARGRGGGGGGGFRGGGGGFSGGGGARTSVSRPSGGFSSSASRDVNRNVNRNVDRDVNVHGDHGYYRGGSYYGGAPVARAAAFGVAAGVTAAAIGSVAYSLPYGCNSFYYSASPYYNCGGTYYAPQYSGTDVTYIVVDDPDGADVEVEVR